MNSGCIRIYIAMKSSTCRPVYALGPCMDHGGGSSRRSASSYFLLYPSTTISLHSSGYKAAIVITYETIALVIKSHFIKPDICLVSAILLWYVWEARGTNRQPLVRPRYLSQPPPWDQRYRFHPRIHLVVTRVRILHDSNTIVTTNANVQLSPSDQ
jgi:hypothetical protein